MYVRRFFVASLLGALLVGTASAQERVDNPEFTGWMKFKKGTTITLKFTNTQNGKTRESTSVEVLDEVGKGKLILLKTSTSEVNGKMVTGRPVRFDIQEKQRVPRDEKAEDWAILKPSDTVEEGTEKIKIGKTEIEAKWYLAKGKTLLSDARETKIWTSPEVPGLLVKKVVKTDGKSPRTETTEVISMTKKK